MCACNVCVFMHVCVYACMYVCLCVCVCMHVRVEGVCVCVWLPPKQEMLAFKEVFWERFTDTEWSLFHQEFHCTL